MEVANTLAYYDIDKIMAVKICILQISGSQKSIFISMSFTFSTPWKLDIYGSKTFTFPHWCLRCEDRLKLNAKLGK
jgi:hypothetical protein